MDISYLRKENMTKIELGKKGEIYVQKYLEKLGYFIVARNFKCPYGEIDIIGIDKNELVFIEVKTRCSKQYGEGREAVNKIKKKHIKKASNYFIYQNSLENHYIRFDVVEVYFKKNKFWIYHLKNVLW